MNNEREKILELLVQLVQTPALRMDQVESILPFCDRYISQNCIVDRAREEEKIPILVTQILRRIDPNTEKEFGELLMRKKIESDEFITESLLIYDYAYLREKMPENVKGYDRLYLGHIIGSGCVDEKKKMIINNYAENIRGKSVEDFSIFEKNMHMLFVNRHEAEHIIQYSIDPKTNNPEEQLILNDMAIMRTQTTNYMYIHDFLLTEYMADVRGETETVYDADRKYEISQNKLKLYKEASKEKMNSKYSEKSPRRRFKELYLSMESMRNKTRKGRGVKGKRKRS